VSRARERSEAALLSRRAFLVLGVGAFAVGALRLAPGRQRLVRRSLPMMGTLAEIAVCGAEPGRAHAAIDAAFAELRRTEALMTRFRADSDVGRANRLAFRQAVEISPETAAVLEEALRWADASGGAFDPCLGAAAELWDVPNRREPPPHAEVRALAGRHLHRALDLERRGGAARLRVGAPDARIDLGGIAKGWGVDRAVEALRRHGVQQAFVNVGGDLYALGRSEDGDPWRVGVRRADDPARLATTLELSDAAVATSGDYFQYFEHRGRRYHHLLDPGTAAPRRSPDHSVTVVAATCVQADVAATATFGMEAVASERLLRRLAPGSRRLAERG
jgi:thiamine biosynthesis lipoprotein